MPIELIFVANQSIKKTFVNRKLCFVTVSNAHAYAGGAVDNLLIREICALPVSVVEVSIQWDLISHSIYKLNTLKGAL